jgi:hypothetical protein
MPRGGKREGAGGKPTWRNGKTKTIRVPIVLAEEVLKIARELDEKGFIERDTESKVLNLSGITVPEIRGKKFVFLQDLVRLGYEFKPEKLAARIIDEIYREEIKRGQKNQDYSPRN